MSQGVQLLRSITWLKKSEKTEFFRPLHVMSASFGFVRQHRMIMKRNWATVGGGEGSTGPSRGKHRLTVYRAHASIVFVTFLKNPEKVENH